MELIQGGAVDEDVVAIWHALTTSERHVVGRVRHGVVHSHESLMVGVLQLLLM